MSVADDVIGDVRDAVGEIPPGRVASYGDIAERVGAGARQVGMAMSLLDGSPPWWRVVHADSTPATCHGGAAPGLLAGEGTPMGGARVDMAPPATVGPHLLVPLEMGRLGVPDRRHGSRSRGGL